MKSSSLTAVSLVASSFFMATTIAEDVIVTVDHVPGESGLVYASECCVPDFFLPGEGYIQTSNCGTTSAGACVQLRAMGIWLFEYPETPEGGAVPGARSPGTGLAMLAA